MKFGNCVKLKKKTDARDRLSLKSRKNYKTFLHNRHGLADTTSRNHVNDQLTK